MVLNVGFGSVVDLHGTDAAQAESLWLAVDAVADGLSGGMEIAGPVWILLASVAALRAGALSRPLNHLGVVISVAGLFTIVPGLADIAIVFGPGLIVWLGWVGIGMYREAPAVAEVPDLVRDRG